MTDWCAEQLPEIARRVLAEEQDGRPPDQFRKAWAEQVLAYFDGRAAAAASRQHGISSD